MKETTVMPASPVKIQPLAQRKAWSALTAHFNQVRDLHLRDLFAQDPKRDERMTLEAVDLGSRLCSAACYSSVNCL